MEKEWFASWFDSPYYHYLYKSRDENEAKLVIDNLTSTLDIQSGAKVLDLACGRGRHARYLAEKGFDVTGLDISGKSISYARQFEQENLSFFLHDMRQAFRINYFDAVVNFFTSFGYFDNDADHLRTMQNVNLNLKPGGVLLLDYFNSNWIRQQLIPSEVKTVEGITFELIKNTDERYVYKTVEFSDQGRNLWFREQVRLFTLADFEALFNQAGLKLIKYFGGYDLLPFDPVNSQRLILVAQKQ